LQLVPERFGLAIFALKLYAFLMTHFKTAHYSVSLLHALQIKTRNGLLSPVFVVAVLAIADHFKESTCTADKLANQIGYHARSLYCVMRVVSSKNRST